MVVEIVNAFLDTIEALFGGIATGIVGMFETLIWIPPVGETPGELTSLGTWMLIFMGFSFALTIFYAIFRKVA